MLVVIFGYPLLNVMITFMVSVGKTKKYILDPKQESSTLHSLHQSQHFRGCVVGCMDIVISNYANLYNVGIGANLLW